MSNFSDFTSLYSNLISWFQSRIRIQTYRFQELKFSLPIILTIKRLHQLRITWCMLPNFDLFSYCCEEVLTSYIPYHPSFSNFYNITIYISYILSFLLYLRCGDQGLWLRPNFQDKRGNDGMHIKWQFCYTFTLWIIWYWLSVILPRDLIYVRGIKKNTLGNHIRW